MQFTHRDAPAAGHQGDEFWTPSRVQVLVFIFSAVTFNYGLALISNMLSLSVSLRSMNRFGTNAVAYLEAVKEIAGPTSLDSLTRVQSAIDCMKIASSLEKVDTFLKVRPRSTDVTQLQGAALPSCHGIMPATWTITRTQTTQ